MQGAEMKNTLKKALGQSRINPNSQRLSRKAWKRLLHCLIPHLGRH